MDFYTIKSSMISHWNCSMLLTAFVGSKLLLRLGYSMPTYCSRSQYVLYVPVRKSNNFFSIRALFDSTKMKSQAMGRKRNQGKARKAAKAKAEEEAQQEESGKTNNPTATNDGQEQPPEALLKLQQCRCSHPSIHGTASTSIPSRICLQFVSTFRREFYEYADRDNVTIVFALKTAKTVTEAEFAEVWNDPAKLEIVLSVFLGIGTQAVLDGKDNAAREIATFARYFEQCIAVELKESQAFIAWPKIEEAYGADLHTLVKFFRHRIPCSCLDEKYEEVKSITKLGVCYNPQCTIPYEQLERSKTMYCSRCRCTTYCSRECQEAGWKAHKPFCDRNAARKAEFDDAKHQNMYM
eukprot:scaffold7325_cov153-Skeletonema_menzelii.AAC.4